MQPSSSSLICAIDPPVLAARAYWTLAPDQAISRAYSTTSSAKHKHKKGAWARVKGRVVVVVVVVVPW